MTIMIAIIIVVVVGVAAINIVTVTIIIVVIIIVIIASVVIVIIASVVIVRLSLLFSTPAHHLCGFNHVDSIGSWMGLCVHCSRRVNVTPACNFVSALRSM